MMKHIMLLVAVAVQGCTVTVSITPAQTYVQPRMERGLQTAYSPLASPVQGSGAMPAGVNCGPYSSPNYGCKGQ